MNDLISRQAEQQGRVFKEIVVEYPSYNTYPERKWIPYFSIKYTEDGQEFIGYGTYKPEVLSEYLKEYFMSSAQPETHEKRTETHSCDCISRQAAIDTLSVGKEILNRVLDETDVVGTEREKFSFGLGLIESAIKDIKALPSAQPEPKWILCSERLPEEPYGCLVTVWDTNPVTMDEFENILPYFVGWDGEQWNDGDGEQCPFEVVAWMPLPEPYRGD